MMHPMASDDPEARALLTYVAGVPAHETLVQRYREALDRHALPQNHLDRSVVRSPLLLRALDAASRLCKPQCLLQKKLLIAAAIRECDPSSASALLPCYQSRMRIIIILAIIALQTIIVWLIALPLLCVPRFLSRNAGQR